LNEPKKETVRITLPPRPVDDPGSETARIKLPARPPANGSPEINAPLASAASAAPSSYPGSARVRAEPKKETARISVLPDPPAPPRRPKTVKMTKTQPLITAPEMAAPAVPIRVARSTTSASDVMQALTSVPLPFCWALLGISALLFILQIWIYLS
jgi:hypothetical protein